MDSNEQNLPSEKLQKEFEENPIKILEIIRKEKEKEIELKGESENEINETNSDFFNTEKKKIETLIIHNIYDFTGKNNINNKKDVNYIVNNINNNYSINDKKNNNTIFNKNINTSYNNTYVNYNYNYNSNIDFEKNIENLYLLGPYRVFPGSLSVSRTIGDPFAKLINFGGNPKVVISEPDIYCFDIEKEDVDFLILGCDGIFDHMSSKDVFKCAWMMIDSHKNYNTNIDIASNALSCSSWKSRLNSLVPLASIRYCSSFLISSK